MEIKPRLIIGLLLGLISFAILVFVQIIAPIPYFDVLSSFLPPVIAGVFSDDNSWFWSGFLTVFISIVFMGYLSASMMTASLFLYFEYPATWLFGVIMLPIIGVLAAVIGGVLGFLGRMIGELLGVR